MTPKNSSLKEYIGRINKVLDYIEKNLDSELNLEKLASVSCFSPFHFHRIFSSMMGETLNNFIKRIRIEKASAVISQNPGISMTEAALKCGFTSSSAFSRAFRERFNVSPSEYQSQMLNKISKIHQTDSKNRKANGFTSSYFCDEQKFERRNSMSTKPISEGIKEMPELNVAYIRHIGSYKTLDDVFDKLFKWAGPRGLIRFPETKVLGIYHDDPNVTDEDKLRASVCITVPKETKTEGEIGSIVIPGGKFACLKFEITKDEFQEAWNYVMGQWLPVSGYEPDDRMCYELYLNNYREHPEQKFITEIYLPVKAL